MKIGIEDKVSAKVEARSQRFRDKRDEQLKGVKPAFVEPPNPIDELYRFDNMGWDEKMNYMNQFGVEAYMKLDDHISKIRRRYGGK